jgi:hypothetical protein
MSERVGQEEKSWGVAGRDLRRCFTDPRPTMKPEKTSHPSYASFRLAADGTNVTFTFLRAQNSIDPETALWIETGTDLATWDSAPSPYTVPDGASADPPVTVVKDSPEAGKDTVTLTVPQDSSQKFARLKVLITP